jgi:hypothetical protein
MCISKVNDECDNQAVLSVPCTAGHPLDGKRVFCGGQGRPDRIIMRR